VKRPTLTISGQSIDQEEYEHFCYQYKQYKERLCDDRDSPAKLLGCLSPDVSKMLYSSLGAEMKLTCTNVTCQTELNYSEPIILSLFINGLSDMEFQQDLLAEQNMTLTKALTQAVARETTKRSQGVLDSNQQVVKVITSYKKGLNKVVVPPDCCGNKRHSDRKDCPAKENMCSCVIKGHFRKYCYRDGKKRNAQSGGGGKKTTQEKTETKEETSHGIGETCFTLNESCFRL
jgi:hypothetical protein